MFTINYHRLAVCIRCYIDHIVESGYLSAGVSAKLSLEMSPVVLQLFVMKLCSQAIETHTSELMHQLLLGILIMGAICP
ncbi:hypothetical protein [Marinobacter panjinensis]|uniref:hypothetical protein n=1 Tax=Marinobacter panjinensis TaxID=2576384 RepID=UPI001D18BF74|nr:hypothetical protein [Marinobacter panjinensis]